MKFSPAGVLLWKRQLGTAESESASGVVTDQTGNVYILGQTEGSLAGANRGHRRVGREVFASGSRALEAAIGTPDFDLAADVATDDKGGVYIAGHTAGSLAGPYRGIVDAWIVKFQNP